MEILLKTFIIGFVLCVLQGKCESAKINTPRVLLPWFENLYANFTFEIIEGGCYTWSLSRDDIIDLEPLYEDSWGHCSRAARVSVSKSCVPPGSVIILAEEVNSGEILRGDVDIDKIKSLKVMSTTWKLYLEEAPEAFEVVAYDDQGNKFSTLEGLSFKWSIENLGNAVDEDLLVTLVRWRDTDYEAPRSVAELEALGQRSYSVLLYGQAMGDSRVTVCLDDICTDFTLKVVASVVLTPAAAIIAPGDTLRYRVVRARAGRLTVQDVADTLYTMNLPDTSKAYLEDSVSLVRGTELGSTSVLLMSGINEVASAVLTIAEPYSIRVTLRPHNLIIRGEEFLTHCTLLDKDGHMLFAGDQVLIRLVADGEANVDLLRSTENGTLTDAVANNAGPFTITARLHSVAGKTVNRKVEGQVSGVAVDPLEVVPPELYIAWTETIQDITLRHSGGGSEQVTWSVGEKRAEFALAGDVLTVRGVGDTSVRVQLTQYPHVAATGRVWSAPPEYLQVAGSGHARVGKPYHLHVALTATHPDTGELYNFHVCNCGSFSVSLLEGPEPLNVTSATWVTPAEGACCVVELVWGSRGVCSVRVSRGRAGGAARVAVRAAPALLWPHTAAAVVGAELPVIAEGESLVPMSGEPRTVELSIREAPPPHRRPDAQLFTVKCRRKGESRLELISHTEEERESAEFEVACAPHVSRVRLEPADTPGNCSGPTKIWLRPGHEVTVKVTLLDAIGRELLDERGPKMTWDIEPYHAGIQYKSTDRLYVETHPDFEPVPVPWKYYQLVVAEELAIGWSGTLKAHIPEASASIQAKVAAPLKVEPLQINLAWEGETATNIATVTGGSGRYTVESAGVTGSVEGGALSATVPGPGAYDLVVVDQCVGEKRLVEVQIEEVLSVEVSTSRAVGVGSCVPIAALVRGVSHRVLAASRQPQWRVGGPLAVEGGRLCGVSEGAGRVRAALAGVWSAEVEVLVFPPLQIVPAKSRLPPGARLQLRHTGGPPPHLAATSYRAVAGVNYVEVSPTGSLHGVALGTSKIKLVATDIANVEMASAEAEVEVIPISGLRVKAATQTLLVGAPSPLWVEAAGLSAASLAALHPPPRVTFSVRDSSARLVTTHADDMLERTIAEGLSVRVVPLKPGVITIDVRVRNMGQVAETRSWDSTIEILAISDIRTSVDGLPDELASGERLALSTGTTVQLKSLPRSQWEAFSDGAFDVTSNGELNALKPGHGVLIGRHKDERNNVYRETSVHVEVSVPHYCTAEPAGDDDETAVRLTLRNSVGRALLAPDANISLETPIPAIIRKSQHSALGSELVLTGLEPGGALVSFRARAGGAAVTDEVWVVGVDPRFPRILVTGGWAVCLEGVGWAAPPGVSVYPGSGVSLALMTSQRAARHVLRLDRSRDTVTLHQMPTQKMEFLPGEWPASMVPLSIEGTGLSHGPLLCSEEQKYALEGLQVQLPYTCRTKAPHTAEPVLDIMNGQIGCSIIPATVITDALEVELCAEWDAYRTCTKVLLLPYIKVSQSKISLLDPPAIFTISGHVHALKALKLSASPGLKLETVLKDNVITVMVKSESSTCGTGWVNVKSKLTSQDLQVEVERECEVACGTLLGAIFSIVKPYLATLMTIMAVALGMLYIQSRFQQKSNMSLPRDPSQTVLPPDPPRARTWSRSPYSAGPAAPVYGDASVLPDNSFSPNSTRMHSRFL